MKLYNGMWLTDEQYKIDFSQQIYDYELKADRLELYLPFIYVNHRGNLLDGGLITASVSFFDDNVHFEFLHHYQTEQSKYNIERKFELGEITESEKQIIYELRNNKVVMNKDDCSFKIYYKGKYKMEIPAKSIAYVVDQKDENLNSFSNKYLYVATKIGVNESLYGLGERFNHFVKNGQHVEVWNQDGGTASTQTYKNIPFLVSSNGYGIFVDHSEAVEFEIGSNIVEKNMMTVNNEVLRFDVILADNLKKVVGKYTKMTGEIPSLPEWSYGLWLSTSFTTDYSEKTVLSFIDEMIKRDLPFEVFHFDCFWMKEYEWTNFEFNKDRFPDPVDLIKKIHERGKKVCLWINPYIGQKSSVFNEAYENGYLIMGENDRPWQIDLWQPGLAVVDFTNPEAVTWYQNKLRNLLNMGVDSFKTDFGERIPVPNSFYKTNRIKYFDGSDPYVMHNYFTYIYNKTVYDLLKQVTNQACLFARSATVGSQSLPVHWGGDSLSSYESMAESLRGGLSLTLGGFAYWSHDIGGFEAGCEPDIYKRWTQFGLLSSHSRYHGNSEYKVPWLYGEEAVEVSRKFIKLKNRLMPYFYEMQQDAMENGIGFIRPLVMEFESDLNTHQISTQYMLGSSLLVAPIFNSEGKVKYYLPNGRRWYNILTREVKNGDMWYEEQFDYFHLPLMLKEGDALVLSNNTQNSCFNCEQGIEIIAFNVEHDISKVVLVHDEEVNILITKEEVRCEADIEIKVTRVGD